MKLINFKKTKLASSLFLIFGAAMSTTINAAEETSMEQAEDVEVIKVKGIRGSLIRSMDLKRDTMGVMDAISAEEMGKFPDTNLAESLQRITGVTISRSNGEGSQITVRGFGPDFNLVTLNGRQMPGTGFSRSFSFENLSSEGVSALEIKKTASAETPTGGLGATVNIVTNKPLKSPGRTLAVMGKAIMDTSNVEGDDVTPEWAAIYSDTFRDGMLGVSATISHHRRDFQKQQASIQGWQYGYVDNQDNAKGIELPFSPSGAVVDNRPVDAQGNLINAFTDKSTGEAVSPFFFPKDMNYGIENSRRERTNGQVTLQYSPKDNIIFTLDHTVTLATTATESVGWGIWNNFGANINAYELDKNGTAVFANIGGDDGSFSASKGTTEVDSKSTGFNLDWQITDDLHFNFDLHSAKSEIDNGADKGSGNSGQVILGSDKLTSKTYDYRNGEVPHVNVLWNNGTNQLHAADIDSNFSQFLHSPGESKVDQVQADVTWYSTLNSPLAVVKFGAAVIDQSLSGINAWSGLRGGPGFDPSFTEIFPEEMFITHDTGDFLDAFAGGGSDLAPNYYYSYDYDRVVAIQTAVLTEEVMGSNVYVPDAYFNTVDRSLVEETTSSLYLQTQWDFDVADMMMTLNAGVRYEKTDVESPSISKLVDEVRWVAASEWITYYKNGGEGEIVNYTGSYDLLLPMFDLKVDVTDDFVARFSVGKSITRAGLGNLTGATSFTGSPKIGARTGSRGNTNLKPFQSTNIDLSFEYYYDDASYLSLGLFSKDVDDWIEGSTVQHQELGVHDIYKGKRYNEAVDQITLRGEQPTDSAIYQQMLSNGHGNADGEILPDPEDPLITWQLSSPENVGKRSVYGAEFAVQHLFGDSGFGTAFNATIVDGDVTYDPYVLGTQAVLPGISDSMNFQAFYEKDGLSIKATYAWRDAHLIGQGQSQGSSEAPPQFAREFAQWDMSINYDVSDSLTVFFDGVNLNNETEQGYGRFEEQFLYARQYGPRYIVGGRYSF
ncbi:TonB-dependent receptor [Catenovulum sediminis]|uniref:TonB-dependent receptor n=1 Tax=Catenovulum sediminis TaxID=1740262 RepID=A0ABV1RF58_9ALTE|nr:TonB-dependent receptor [Catenovulum sediminis]